MARDVRPLETRSQEDRSPPRARYQPIARGAVGLSPSRPVTGPLQTSLDSTAYRAENHAQPRMAERGYRMEQDPSTRAIVVFLNLLMLVFLVGLVVAYIVAKA